MKIGGLNILNSKAKRSAGEQPTAEASPIHRDDQREIRGRDSPGTDTLGPEVKGPDPFYIWLLLEQQEQG